MLSRQPIAGLRWIDSLGGPLLLLDRQWLPHWRGYLGPSSDESGSDYARACAIDETLGILPIGPGQGLILGDEPLSTAWLPLPGLRGGLIVRWRWAPDEAAVLAALPRLPSVMWLSNNLTLPLPTGQAVLFDTTDSGERIGANLSLTLDPGVYSVDTADYAPDATISLLLHRLTRTRGA